MADKAASSIKNNQPASSSSSNANSINAKYFQNKQRINKNADKEEQKDALMFESLLQSDKSQSFILANVMQEQQRNNQQFNQQLDDEKKDNYKTDALKEIENKNVVEASALEKTHTAEFCQALTENHNKHNFEVTLPKLGTFKIETNATGKQLKFDVSTKQKDAFEWVRKNQSNIEENISKDLNLDVVLGIEYAV